MKHFGTKTLETKNLILRKIQKNDYKTAFKNYCSDEDVTDYVLWEVHKNEEETKELFSLWMNMYEEEDTYKWVIVYKENNEVIGMIDAFKKLMKYDTVEIGYCLGKKYWNNGIMTEALKEVIRFMFEECNAETIYAEYLENNPASGKVMKNVGMKYDGKLRSRILDRFNRRNDLISYSIIKKEYFKDKLVNSNNN